MDSGEENINSFHLAGIIPVAGQPMDFNFPWDDCLMPIGKDYLAVERSVLECAYAGCETIWIVCNEDVQPLVKSRLGDYILDPVFATNSFRKHPSEFQKHIPIFYVPVHPKDRLKRNSIAWSVLYGANSAYFVSKKISRWVTPDRYYASFPWGIYDPQLLREHRKHISSKNKVILSNNDSSVVEGEYLGFSFDAEDFFILRDRFKENYKSLGRGVQKTKLAELFCYLSTDNRINIPVPWYNKIDNWEDYSSYVGSENSKLLIPVSDFILKRKLLNRIPSEEQ
tara:strand:+ start:2749 stop:3594 length:846 start_codon:yes stop_codon:yes gene_type:complete